MSGYAIRRGVVYKDPSQYWYIEKYVYGVLKEIIEIALGAGTTFSAIDSGYDDDTFYGWSISNTSTTRTFTNTTTYKNTTTAVKNALDDENTLKIYAIYKYTSIETKSTTEDSGILDIGNNTYTITVTNVVAGTSYVAYTNSVKSIEQGRQSTGSAVNYFPIVTYNAPVTVGSGVATSATISYTFSGIKKSEAKLLVGTSSSSSTPTYTTVTVYTKCTLQYYYLATSTKYRVTAH